MNLTPSLRKAAILISALDTSTADRLLDQMGPAQAARVREAVMQLDGVDPAEQEAILAEFFAGPTKVSSDDGGVELAVSAASASTRRASEAPAVHPRFQFLQEASGEELARRLRGEHPQLMALVVAHLSAEKSAELLEHLPAKVRDEVLDRLHHLDDAEPEVISELERELARLFAGTLRPAAGDGKRHDHLQAILAHLRRKSQRAAESRPPSAISPATPRTASQPPAEKISFEQIMSLSAADFFALFEEADPRVVMLALAGAPRRLFERYLAQFSTERALEFERHLEQLRPLRLRDVEAAQQELATLAGRRLTAAKAAAESSRRFAAAA